MEFGFYDLLALICLSASLGCMVTVGIQTLMLKEAAHVVSPPPHTRPYNVSFFPSTYISLMGRNELEGKMMDRRKVQEVLLASDDSFVEETRRIMSGLMSWIRFTNSTVCKALVRGTRGGYEPSV